MQVGTKLAVHDICLFWQPQAEREQGRIADLEAKAELDAQSAALRARMNESHLAKFKSEAKCRWVHSTKHTRVCNFVYP